MSVNKAIDLSQAKTLYDDLRGRMVSKNYVDTALTYKADITYVNTEVAKKVSKSYVDDALVNKADKSYVDTAVSGKASTTYVDNAVAGKADTTYVDTGLSAKANTTYVDAELAKKANVIEVTKEASEVIFSDQLDGSSTKNIIAYINPSQDLNNLPYPYGPGGGSNIYQLGSASDYYPSDTTLDHIADYAIYMVMRGSGMTYLWRTNCGFAGNKTYSISSDGSVTSIRYFIRLRKSDDSGWMTNSDASISGGQYNSFFGGWFFNGDSSSRRFELTVSIPACLYWDLGIGYNNNNGVEEGTIVSIGNIKVEEGSTVTPYSNICPITTSSDCDIYHSDGVDVSVESVPFSASIYGGYYDGSEGKVYSTYTNIASYDGETLPGKWISDRDVYSVGGTPTTGAQVVYVDTTPTVTTTSKLSFVLYSGTNIIGNNKGDTAVTYLADTKKYIDKNALPEVNTGDNDKFLRVVSGEWEPTVFKPLPDVNSGDNGKFLKVVSGEWASSTIPTISVEGGGTGATTASGARTNLGLGEAATYSVENKLNVATEGSVLDARQGKVLNDKISGKLDFIQLTSVSSNSNRSYTVSNTAKLIIMAFGASTSKNVWLVNVASGTPTYISLVPSGTSTVLSMSTSSNTVTITNSGSNGAQVYALEFSGSIEDAST